MHRDSVKTSGGNTRHSESWPAVGARASVCPASLLVRAGPVPCVCAGYRTIEFGHRPSTKFTVTVTSTATGSPFNRAGVYFH